MNADRDRGVERRVCASIGLEPLRAHVVATSLCGHLALRSAPRTGRRTRHRPPRQMTGSASRNRRLTRPLVRRALRRRC